MNSERLPNRQGTPQGTAGVTHNRDVSEQAETEGGREGAQLPVDAWIVYQGVAARRLQWDSLVWQAPALSLTAQAFLLTITLSADYEVWPRRVAAILALAVTVMTMNLLARHRVSEISDAEFLEEFETKHASWLGPAMKLPESGDAPTGPVHGENFKHRRNVMLKRGPDGRCMTFAANPPSGRLWFWGLSVFGLTALLVLVGSFLEWTWIFPPYVQ